MDAITIQELSKLFEVSERTIRYDLEDIQYWLGQKGFQVDYQHGKGTCMLHLAPAQIPQVVSIIHDDRQSYYVRSSRERKLTVLYRLLVDTTFIPLQELADYLHVSKGTIIQDLQKVEAWLSTFHIKLARSKKGYILQASEKDRRQALLSVVSWIGSIREEEDPFVSLEWPYISEDELYKIKPLIRDTLVNYHLDDYSCLHLYRLICVQLLRIRQGYTFTEEERDHSALDYEGIGDLTALFTTLEQEFSILLNQNERAFICEHLLSYCFEIIPDPIFQSSGTSFEWFMSKLLNRLGISSTSIETIKEARFIWEKIHWQVHFQLIATSPLTEKVQEQYEFILYHTLDLISEVPDESFQHATHDQLSPLVMFVASIFENQSSQSKIYQVALVCPSDTATGQLFAARIRNLFPQVHIQGIYSQLSTHSNQPDVDFICSTVTLAHSTLPVLVISPLLNDHEIYKMKQFLFRLEKERSLQSKSKHVLDFSSIIGEEFIQTSSQNLLEQALREGVQLLVKQNIVEEDYLIDILKVVENQGLYFEIAPGLLLPHAISRYVNRVGVSLVKLKEPIPISEGRFVRSIITLATPDSSSHLSLMRRLHEFLLDENNLKEFIYDH